MLTIEEMLRVLEPLLNRTEADPQQIVVMTCGIAGAGKSTLAKAIVASRPGFERISIDTTIHTKHGMYGVDYPGAKYQDYMDEADVICQDRLRALLATGEVDVVLDLSFYNRDWRDEVKQLVENSSARPVLVYLKASKEVLWRRITERKAGSRDADSAFDVSETLLAKYVSWFQAPEGEGEIVFQVE